MTKIQGVPSSSNPDAEQTTQQVDLNPSNSNPQEQTTTAEVENKQQSLKNSIVITKLKTTGEQSTVQQKNSIDYNVINVNKEKVRLWIYEQAKKFRATYFSQETSGDKFALSETSQQHSGLNVLNRLQKVVQCLDLSPLTDLDSTVTTIQPTLDTINKKYSESLLEISNVLNDTDISSFEMIHSGLIEKLVSFLSIRDLSLINIEKQLNKDLPKYSSFSSVEHCYPAYIDDLNNIIKNEFISLRCKQFLNVFSHLPFSYHCQELADKKAKTETINFFSSLVSKLHNCVNQLEQFAVKVHDVPSSAGDAAGSKNAIKFFNTHQLKCLLRRHPSCATTSASDSTPLLSQWKGKLSS